MGLPDYVEHYRVSDWEQWEGDWELIEGVPYAMAPSPVFGHQRIGALLLRQLDEALEECPRCQVVYEVDIQFAEDTVVRPDLVVVCGPQDPDDRLRRAPALIVEILSPQSARRDEHLKRTLYEQEGVAWYLLIYPKTHQAKLWHLVEGRYLKEGDYGTEPLSFDLQGCPVRIDLARLWGALERG